MTNQSKVDAGAVDEQEAFKQWADMFPRMSPDCRAIAWEAWQAALSRQPAQTVSEQSADQWNAAIEAAKERFRAMPHEAWQGIEVVEVLDSLTNPAPADEQPSQPSTCECHVADECAAKCQPEASKRGDQCVPHTYAGFMGGYAALNKGLPSGQEIFDAGMRAGRDIQWPSQPETQQPAQELPPPCPECKTNYPLHDLDCATGKARARAQSAAPAAGMTDAEIYDLVALHETPEGLWNGPKFTHEGILNFARALLSAAPAAAPEGWKPVPVEPTVEMLTSGSKAADLHSHSPRGIYAAMLAAAPQPVAAQVGMIRESELTPCRHCGFRVKLNESPGDAAHPKAAQDKGEKA